MQEIPFDRQLIEHYAREAGVLRAGIQGLSSSQLNSPPASGGWTIQEIVFHLMQSDLIATDRMFRIIAEDEPVLIGYDESLAAQRLGFERLDPQLACDLFEKNRQMTAAVLRNLPDSAFQRVGLHNERGRVTLAQLVDTYVGHLRGHMKFLLAKRAEMVGV